MDLTQLPVACAKGCILFVCAHFDLGAARRRGKSNQVRDIKGTERFFFFSSCLVPGALTLAGDFPLAASAFQTRIFHFYHSSLLPGFKPLAFYIAVVVLHRRCGLDCK
jgi:hypothetical protein